jgi:hypothetical protein
MVASAEPVVNATVEAIVEEAVEKALDASSTKQVYSTVDAPIYSIPTRQRNMQVGTMVPGRLYEYKGKDVNNEGTFYLIGTGYVFADDKVHIK